ncbi:hypothetical protein PR048_011103 [Dryococelus australis]|uniref:Uncharacterized protein n=1 Tax=Dryococelus australis TaxID=614101 RepID=A0ABQ9HKP4_9NEOP|nr:hypothetical protein PR048_011103 [Dryococelus australis]
MDMKCKGKQDAESSTKAQQLSQMCEYEMSSTTSSGKNVWRTWEILLQIAVGLTVHSVTRSKFLIQFLHSLGSSIEYNKLLRIETQTASEVIRCMEANGADNIDVQEDTPYGKGTLHGTVMVVYQEKGETDAREPHILSKLPSRRSLDTIPKSFTELSHCSVPLSQKLCVPKIYCKVNVKSKEKELLDSNLLEDVVWMILKVTAIQSSDKITTLNYDFHDLNVNDTNPAASDTISTSPALIPILSAYHSLVSKPMCLKRVCVLPLIDSSPSSTSTQITSMEKLEAVTNAITGTKRSFKKKSFRPGELHIIMAILHAIGTFIDGTGLECALADLYSDTVISQMVAGKCVRRGVEAHTTLTLALFRCYSHVFQIQHKDMKEECGRETESLIAALQADGIQEINSVHRQAVESLKNSDKLYKMEEFNSVQGDGKPNF